MAQNEYIPLELYHLIVKTISDWNTLLSLLLTSRHLSAEAEHILYHNVEWDDDDSKSSDSDVVSQTLFLRTVIDCQRVTQLVWECHFVSHHLLIVDDDPYWTLFPMALCALVNLKELKFRNYGQAPSAHVLQGCTFQLVSLYWDCCHEENELSVFLAGQEVLERLCVDYWRGKCAGPPAPTLQNLSFLAQFKPFSQAIQSHVYDGAHTLVIRFQMLPLSLQLCTTYMFLHLMDITHTFPFQSLLTVFPTCNFWSWLVIGTLICSTSINFLIWKDSLFPCQSRPSRSNVKTLSLGCIPRPNPFFSSISMSLTVLISWVGINVGIVILQSLFKLLLPGWMEHGWIVWVILLAMLTMVHC